jgi:hypothetical protein
VSFSRVLLLAALFPAVACGDPSGPSPLRTERCAGDTSGYSICTLRGPTQEGSLTANLTWSVPAQGPPPWVHLALYKDMSPGGSPFAMASGFSDTPPITLTDHVERSTRAGAYFFTVFASPGHVTYTLTVTHP